MNRNPSKLYDGFLMGFVLAMFFVPLTALISVVTGLIGV